MKAPDADTDSQFKGMVIQQELIKPEMKYSAIVRPGLHRGLADDDFPKELFLPLPETIPSLSMSGHRLDDSTICHLAQELRASCRL